MTAPVEQEVEDPHRVLALFLGLVAHEGGESVQVSFREPRGGGEVLVRRSLLLVELGVEGPFDLGLEHVDSFRAPGSAEYTRYSSG